MPQGCTKFWLELAFQCMDWNLKPSRIPPQMICLSVWSTLSMLRGNTKNMTRASFYPPDCSPSRDSEPQPGHDECISRHESRDMCTTFPALLKTLRSQIIWSIQTKNNMAIKWKRGGKKINTWQLERSYGGSENHETEIEQLQYKVSDCCVSILFPSVVFRCVSFHLIASSSRFFCCNSLTAPKRRISTIDCSSFQILLNGSGWKYVFWWLSLN